LVGSSAAIALPTNGNPTRRRSDDDTPSTLSLAQAETRSRERAAQAACRIEMSMSVAPSDNTNTGKVDCLAMRQAVEPNTTSRVKPAPAFPRAVWGSADQREV
jgi:hypothetical protein